MKYTDIMRVKVNPSIKEKIKQRSEEQGLKPSDLVRLALEKGLEKDVRYDQKQRDIIEKLFKAFSVYFLDKEDRDFLRELSRSLHQRQYEALRDIVKSFRETAYNYTFIKRGSN